MLHTGNPLRFGLLLFGWPVDLQAYALVAIERRVEAGARSLNRFRLLRQLL